MRVFRFAMMISMSLGIALFASGVQAGDIGDPSTLADGFYIIDSGDANNECEVGSDGTEFEAFGTVSGTGTAGQAVSVDYETPQPTNVSRNDDKISVKQNKFSRLTAHFGVVTVGPLIVEKCSVSGSVDVSKLTGKVTAKCKTDTLFANLSANQVASLQTAFDGNKNVKVEVNSDATKGSISITCKGDASLD